MKLRLFVTAALVVCLAATAVAQLSEENKAWGQGAYQYLMTKEETSAWKALKSDADAKAFVDLFWARRDPTPDTPANEYRNEIEGRIQFADKNFGERRAKGSLTDRGRILVLHGAPKRMSASGPAAPGMSAPSSQDDGTVTGANQEVPSVIWLYEDGTTKEIFGVPRAQISFSNASRDEFKLDRAAVNLREAQSRAIAKAITQPNLKSASTAAAVAPAPVPVAPAAPAVVTQLTTEALRAAVAEFKSASTNAYANKAHVTWGEYVTGLGQTFVPIGLYVPKAAGISGDVTLFGVVEDASGASVLAFEQPATLVASKDDFFVDKSITLPGGKHRGIFGLAQNGKVVALTSADLDLKGNLDKDATAISQLILSNNVFPLQASQKADDPFSFGGVRVVPKADRTFRPSDELWYFFELRNPGLPETADGPVPVNSTEPPQRLPKIQVKLDVTGKTTDGQSKKMSAPPAEVGAIEMKGVPGHYGVGNAIPLSSFKPGEYIFTVKVIDTIKKQSYTLSEPFKVAE